MTSVLKTLVFAGLAGSLLSLTALFSEYHLIFDLISNFRVQYIVLITAVLFFSLLLKTKWVSATLVTCLAVHLFSIANLLIQPDETVEAHSDDAVLRVMTSNLLASNTNNDSHIEFVQLVNADIVVFQEYTPAWHKALSTGLPAYKYKITAPVNTPFGIALYSKLPLKNRKTTTLFHAQRPGIETTVMLGNTSVSIIGAHPPPPLSFATYTERNSYLQLLASKAKSQQTPAIILGDLNITPWSAHYRKMLASGRLYSTRQGSGILPTWPATFFPLQIPIDHILVSETIRTTATATSNNLHSDHRSLWSDLQINTQ